MLKRVVGFVGQKEDFVINKLEDREPVEFKEDRGDVLREHHVGEESCCRVEPYRSL